MKSTSRKTKKDLIYFDNYGILRFDLGGKIILLFSVEILALWLSFMLLGRWKYFSDTKQGMAILGSDVTFLSITLKVYLLMQIETLVLMYKDV